MKEIQTHAQLELIPGLGRRLTAVNRDPRPGISVENRTLGPALVKKGIMARNGSESIQVLINHWRWLEANGYKQQAASCKRQAASLTRKHYNDIQEYTGKKKNENK